MAKSKYKIADIENMSADEITHLPEKELREVIGVMRDVIAKREKRMKSKGYDSPAMHGLDVSGGAISTKGKKYSPTGTVGKNTLQGEAIRAFHQIKAGTSTLKGYETLIKSFSEKHGFDTPEGMTESQYKEVWKLINKMEELSKNNTVVSNAWYGMSSTRNQVMATRIIEKTKMSADDYIDMLTNRVNALEHYEGYDDKVRDALTTDVQNLIFNPVKELTPKTKTEDENE